MLGLVFDPRLLRLAAAGVASRLRPAAAISKYGPLRLRRLPDPVPPSPEWAVLEPLFTGICGSDVTEATLQADWDNPLSALVSFPHVMGHEVVARVATPPGASVRGADVDLTAGDLVVLNPWLGCPPRGTETCPACASGMLPLCARTGEVIPGVEGRGIHTGNIRGLPGGMGTRMLAHLSQLHRLPAGLEPRAGVLGDPLAVGLHAAAKALEGGEGAVVVLGAGTIGLCVSAGLRHLACQEVAVSTAWPYQKALVTALGGRPISARPETAVREVAAASGGRAVRPWRGLPWLASGGAAAVVDAVGSAATAALALAIVRPGGRVVRVGVGRARRTQATLAYFKEAAVVGANGYRPADLDTALALLASGEIPWESWLTHRFPLRAWGDAFRVAAEPQRHDSVKVSLAIA
jgi:threonine dehydrogenase-like Zn-dependent dehydrogenase